RRDVLEQGVEVCGELRPRLVLGIVDRVDAGAVGTEHAGDHDVLEAYVVAADRDRHQGRGARQRGDLIVDHVGGGGAGAGHKRKRRGVVRVGPQLRVGVRAPVAGPAGVVACAQAGGVGVAERHVVHGGAGGGGGEHQGQGRHRGGGGGEGEPGGAGAQAAGRGAGF